MKILFSLTYYTPYVSGLTLYVKRLAEALVKKGHQSSVISCQYDRNLKTEELKSKVKVIRTRPLFKISKGFVSVDWLMRCIPQVRNNDVIIINLPQFEGLVPAVIGKFFGKRVITVYHCEVVLPQGLFNKIIETVLNFSNRWTLSLSDKIITYTKDFRDHSRLLKHYIQKTVCVYPPIPLPLINKRVQNIIIRQLAEKIGVKPYYLVGIAARLAAEKGIEYLLESLPILKDKIKDQKSKIKNSEVKIVFAGSLNPVGEENYRKKIFHLVEKYNKDIIFLGELKEEEMGSFYSLLDVLVLPSVNSTESFGMVQVEAMALGVPVVASDLPGVRVPVQKTGMGRLVKIKDSRELAEAITHVLFNKKKYVKDRKFIQREFSQEKTLNFYQSIL